MGHRAPVLRGPRRRGAALPWGTVERIVYDHPTDGYDLRVDQVSRGGLERFATLASEEYSGREYLG